MMKKIILNLGILFLVLVFIGGIFLGYEISLVKRADLSSQKYVDETVPKIASMWSEKVLLQESSPEFLQNVNEYQLKQSFSQFKRLGMFKSSQPAQGNSFVSLHFPKGKEITARYEKEVSFEKGKTKIKMNLIQRKGTWKILYFYIDAPRFNNETKTLIL